MCLKTMSSLLLTFSDAASTTRRLSSSSSLAGSSVSTITFTGPGGALLKAKREE